MSRPALASWAVGVDGIRFTVAPATGPTETLPSYEGRAHANERARSPLL